MTPCLKRKWAIYNLWTLVCTVSAYLLNSLWLKRLDIGGIAGEFIHGQFNDFFAAAGALGVLSFLCLITDLRFFSFHIWYVSLSYAVFMSFYWEFGTYVFKPDGIFDPLDIGAYLAGWTVYYCVWMIIRYSATKREETLKKSKSD